MRREPPIIRVRLEFGAVCPTRRGGSANGALAGEPQLPPPNLLLMGHMARREVKGLRPCTPYETAPLFLALKYLCSTLSGQDCGYRPPLGHSRDPRRARGPGGCPGCPPATTGEMGVGGRFFTFLLGWGIGRYSGLRGSPGVPAMPSKCTHRQKPISRHQIHGIRRFPRCFLVYLVGRDAVF